MSKRPRRNHSPVFEAKVALATVKGEKTLAELAQLFDVYADQITQVQLVRVGGMSEAGPKLFSFKAEVQYVGEDQIEVSGQRFSASIFELKSPHAIPPVMVWISSEGIVLSIQDSTKQEQRMDLVEFKKYGKF